MSVDIKDTGIIKIVKKSKVLKGASIGFLVGAGTGALLGAVGADMADERGLLAILGAGIFGAAGLLVGTIAGATASPYKEIEIKGKSDVETKEILEKLRRQARIPNAQ